MSDPRVQNAQHDGQVPGGSKMQAVNAFNNPPPKKHAAPQDGKSQEELDEEEWQREKERLSQRLREKRERELREREQQGQQGQQGSANKPPAGDPNKAPGVAPPSGTGDAPKKKKLLNGTNIEYRYPSGSVYVGGFKDGKLHGFGKYKYHPSGDRYEGEWVADMKHGQGMYQYDCGDRYTGEWRAGKKHGKGTYAFASGDEYTGNWKEDKIHGHGVFDIARNGNRYEGNWAESYRQGYGVLKCGNGDVYMGNWTKGKEDKEGVLTYANGNIYAGDWKMGQMDGKGILMEDGQKYTVEHISGYLIAKVPVEADGAVDPDWNKANKLYMQHIERLEAERNGGAAGGGGGGGGGADAEEITKLKLERDMWEKKYNDLLAQKGGGTTTDVADGGADDNLDLNDHAAVRARIAELKEQREMQARRADEAEQKAKQTESQFGELEFENKRLKEAAASGGGAGAAGGDAAAQAELDKMQRRVADLERELNSRKQAATSGNRQSNDPLELKAQLELLEGEVRHLRSTREELQKQRQQNLEAQQSIMQLEQKNEELLKEVNVVRQRASHSSNEANEDAKRQIEQQQEEIKDLRQEVQDQKVAALTNEQSLKKAKQRLRDAEEKALRVSDLEAQLTALKNSKSNANDAIEKRGNELDSLRAKNAELERRLEEMDGHGGAAAAGAAAGAGAGSAAQEAQIKELQAKVDSQHSDYKKEKKKHKKAAAERDELQGKVAALGVELERAKRAAAVADGTVTTVVRVRPPAPNESGKTVVDVPNPSTVTVNGEAFNGFAFCAGPDLNNNIDASLEDLRPTARAVAQGFNSCVMTLGPMGGGKSHFCSAASKTLLGDVFKAVDEATRPGGRAQSFTPSYSITCVEVNCDGMFDLNNSGSTGSDLRAMRDAFGTVVLDGVMSVPCQLARDAAVDYMAAVGRRRRQRSHLIYTLHVTLRHKVSEAVLRGKFTLADLAGPGSLGDQSDVEAAKYVNKSIGALTNVVNALASASSGVPYRDDPLTTVLADALGGNCRLAVVCAVGPNENDAEAAAQAVGVAQKLTSVQCRPTPLLETSETGRLRGLVSQLQSPEAAEPVLHDIDSLRE